MIDLNKQSQTTGDNSTAIQAQSVTIVQADRTFIEGIAKDVIRRELDTLTKGALDEFKKRADNFVSGFIDRLAASKTFNKKKFEEPQFQFSLNDAQREYGKSGAADLKEELINLLLRMNEEPSDEIAKLYAEAIKVIPLLTRAQIKAIALVGLVRYISYGVGNVEQLVELYEKNVFPFLDGAARSSYDFSHIEYARCGQIGIGSFSLTSMLHETYRGIFCKGFPSDAISNDISEETKRTFFMPCLHDHSLQQVVALRKQDLEEKIKQHSLKDQEAQAIRALFQNHMMADNEILALLEKRNARFKELSDYISSTPSSHLSLTSVGMIVAVVNSEGATGEKINLSNWFSPSGQ